MRDSFDTTVRVRVPTALKVRLEAIARARVKLVPEVSREAVLEFVEREEARLGINPPQEPPKEAHAA